MRKRKYSLRNSFREDYHNTRLQFSELEFYNLIVFFFLFFFLFRRLSEWIPNSLQEKKLHVFNLLYSDPCLITDGARNCQEHCERKP